MFLAVLSSAYVEEKLDDGRSASFFAYPGVGTKQSSYTSLDEGWTSRKAEEILRALRLDFPAIMRQRHDREALSENGCHQTPFCVTVDHQTLQDNTVTIRYRDTMKQDRIPVASLSGILTGSMLHARKLLMSL